MLIYTSISKHLLIHILKIFQYQTSGFEILKLARVCVSFVLTIGLEFPPTDRDLDCSNNVWCWYEINSDEIKSSPLAFEIVEI